MKFSIIHPTARVTPAFASPWWKAMVSAHDGCGDPSQVEYIVVVYHSRLQEFWEAFSAQEYPDAFCVPHNYVNGVSHWGRFTVVTNYDRDCLVDQSNAGHFAASGEIIVGNQDDMRYPEHWDADILKLIPDTSQRVCVHALSPNIRPDLLTIPTIITRTLADAIGPISPEYDGMFSDDEFSVKVRQLGKIIDVPMGFEHFHPSTNTAKMDAVYAQENRKEAYRIGLEVFQRRQALGFPYVELPACPHGAVHAHKCEGTPAAMPSQRMIAICTPGEHHCAQWEREYFRVCFALASRGWIIRTYWGYTTNVYATRIGITRDMFKDSETTGQKPDMVLWIDDDNMPSLPAIEMLLSTLDSQPDYAGTAAWCWIRSSQGEEIAWLPSCGNFKPGTLFLLPTLLPDLYADNAAPKQIEWSGFPTIVIRYSAVETLGTEAFRPLYAEENVNGFTGEDISFFACAKNAGLKFLVVPKAKVEHLKFLPIEPDYEIGPKADPARATIVEKDRERLNGPRLEVPSEVKELMEAAM